nr:MAG TPA: hypothetical protein [Bacteriophage sp.]
MEIYENLSFCWYIAIYRRFSLLNFYAILGCFWKQFFPKFSQELLEIFRKLWR